MVLIDSYSETNEDSALNLLNLHPSTDNISAGGQSFTNLADTYKITSAKFYLLKIGLPIGNAHAVLYAHSGTYGVNSLPTGAPLATSDDFDVSTLLAGYAVVELFFTGAEQYEMQADTKYCIVFENPEAGTIDAGNYVRMGRDSIGPTHGGNIIWHFSGAWGSGSDDMCFYVYGDFVAPVGWTGKISGVTDPAEIAGVPVADIATVKGVA